MAEEHRCQEGHRLCANNCGVFGSPATMDMCSKCYRDFRLKEERASSAKVAVEKSLIPPSPSSSSSSSSSSTAAATAAAVASAAAAIQPARSVAAAAEREEVRPAAAAAGRCMVCRKRTGLVGFPCRCGATFCGGHRYPEQHRCTFDFKAAGREAIARENPVVKADKLGGWRI